MITLDQTPTFETNADAAGLQKFSFVKKATAPDGKNVYIFKRERGGILFGFEAFTPTVLKAGTVQKFPNGVTKTIPADIELYPSKTKFGKTAWYCATLDRAEHWFQFLITKGTPAAEPVAEDPAEEVEVISVSPKKFGRAKNERPALIIPDTEFSCNELAELNKVEYPIAATFLREGEASKIVKRTRTERRQARGRETQLYSKV